MRPAPSAAELWGPRGAALALAAPLLLTRYPPMTDLPNHEMLVALWRHMGDPAFAPAGLYHYNLFQTGQLLQAVALALSWALPTDWAMKVTVAISVGLFPLAVARLAQPLGVSRLLGVALSPLALGWTFRWGFTGNLLGLDLLFIALPQLDALSEAPSGARGLAVTLLAVLTWFAHASSALLLGAAAALSVLLRPARGRALALRLAPPAVLLGIAGARLLQSVGEVVPAERRFPVVFTPLLHKVAIAPALLFGPLEWTTWLLLGLIMLGAVAALVWRPAAAGAPDAARGPSRLPYAVLALASLACYLAAPFALHGATFIYQRFLVPTAVLGAMAWLPRRRASGALPALLASAAPLAMLAALAPAFAAADASYRSLDEIIAHVQPGMALAQLYFQGQPGPESFAAHAEGRVAAVRGGRTLATFTDSGLAPVQIDPRLNWVESKARLIRDPLSLKPGHDLQLYRYLLVDLPDPRFGAALVAALAPEARPAAESGSWLLLESTLKVISPQDPEPAPPAGDEPDLRARLRALRQSSRARPATPAGDSAQPGPRSSPPG